MNDHHLPMMKKVKVDIIDEVNCNNNKTIIQHNDKKMSSKKIGRKVVVRLYDLTGGLGRTLSSILLGVEIGGVWHTGVVIDDELEYFYTGGIVILPADEFEDTYELVCNREIIMSKTTRTNDEIFKFLCRIQKEFISSNYNVIHHNCNHFTNKFLGFLNLKNKLPKNILMQHKIIENAGYMGKMIIRGIELAQLSIQEKYENSGAPDVEEQIQILNLGQQNPR